MSVLARVRYRRPSERTAERSGLESRSRLRGKTRVMPTRTALNKYLMEDERAPAPEMSVESVPQDYAAARYWLPAGCGYTRHSCRGRCATSSLREPNVRALLRRNGERPMSGRPLSDGKT